MSWLLVGALSLLFGLVFFFVLVFRKETSLVGKPLQVCPNFAAGACDGPAPCGPGCPAFSDEKPLQVKRARRMVDTSPKVTRWNRTHC